MTGPDNPVLPAHANAEIVVERRHGDPDSRTNTHASVNACNSAQNASIVPEPEHTLGAAKHPRGLTFMFKGQFGGNRCTVLFDTGASISFGDGGWLNRTQEKSGNSMLKVQPLPLQYGRDGRSK